ncbi:hypothetical protein SAMN05421774_11212 [Gemmobacter megaterium]|uniref:Glycosyl transferase family 2 n=1 Tax=Gemmobacter megaterium TaxID=1086013 RepID=A0A1N7QIA5_9RHOB|nr:hypothetical protein [Gemmobacter megaterium]GGE26892.1 hypothetical protein GCM10011345_36140 [Gemmobacter megaterium]SIT22526.1 hypothetical protein SAMN05421774_11212 [Gemmobacter megaterium]
MKYTSIGAFLDSVSPALASAPGALVFAEDQVEVASTLEHALNIGFRTVALFAGDEIELPEALAPRIHRVAWDIHRDDAVQTAVNKVVSAAPGAWLHYCYNAEYLFFPFCETRSIGELTAFHAEERRDAMLTYVIDLYADDLDRHPNAVSLAEALLDRSGYYALGRPDPANHNYPKERQLDFFGGLRWRFEEHVPPSRRRIDRIGLFRARADLALRDDHTFTNEEYNTYACPWHNNLTAAICSFRTAKALRTNPGSRFDIHSFRWQNSTPFQWHSQQLMDLGLMEPGQWF